MVAMSDCVACVLTYVQREIDSIWVTPLTNITM